MHSTTSLSLKNKYITALLMDISVYNFDYFELVSEKQIMQHNSTNKVKIAFLISSDHLTVC